MRQAQELEFYEKLVYQLTSFSENKEIPFLFCICREENI